MNKQWKEDTAVSPVIAVILMVAITVVLSATVYVWVSGFGSHSNQPAKSMSLTSSTQIDRTTYATDEAKSYIVSSATQGMKYSDITLSIDGVTQTFAATGCGANTLAAPASASVGTWGACAGATDRASSATITGGDSVKIRYDVPIAGKTLRLVDAQSNSVIMTLAIG